MSKGTVNKVIILGRLGQDPEMKSTAGGLAIANLNVATNHTSKDQQGNQNETTEWNRCVLFGRTAENAGQYLKKGGLVYLEGRLQTRKWQDQSGADRYSTEIVCHEMQFVGGKQEQGQGYVKQQQDNATQAMPQNSQQGFHKPPPANQQMGTHQRQPQPPGPAQQPQGFDDFDDEIGF